MNRDSPAPLVRRSGERAILLPMEIRVRPPGVVGWRDVRARCALGRGGLGDDKREGDGATPIGRFPLRRVLFRPDRLAAPPTALPVAPLRADDGWCDDPGDGRYNTPVRLPCPARHEVLWRDDGLYDLIVVVGYNDDPPVAGRGSAIFIHVATADYAPTGGCVALALADLLSLVGDCDGDSRLWVSR